MAENTFPAKLESDIATIRSLLDRTVSLRETATELERERTTTSLGLLEHAAATSDYTRKQTDMAAECTALTREQTRLSTRGTELAGIRTDFSRERSVLAGQRTDADLEPPLDAEGAASLTKKRGHHTRPFAGPGVLAANRVPVFYPTGLSRETSRLRESTPRIALRICGQRL